MTSRFLLLTLSIIFTLTSFQNSKSVEIFGTYMLKETTSDKVKISHKIELKKENICNLYTVTKGTGHKEKCDKKGYFEISGDKIIITWSRNECGNCGTYANWYEKDCPIETLVYKENALWTIDKTPKQFIKVRN